MAVVIAVVALNLVVWIGLLCAARWQRGATEERRPRKAEPGVATRSVPGGGRA